MVQLRADLDEITQIVPAPALDILRERPVWVEEVGYIRLGQRARGLCCHWSPSWLVANGLPAEKAGGVEILNAEDFLAWRRQQPYMLLHEFAHALHWRLAGLDEEIQRAYDAAMQRKLYDEVDRNNGERVRAYAATNSHEYFAELSEAYFAVNDFAPYTREPLRKHDPAGFALMERVWTMNENEIEMFRQDRPE